MSWHSIDSLSRILPTVRFSMHYRWGTHYTWGKLTFYPGFVEWYSVPGFDKKNVTFNPFAPELPVTARCGSTSPLWLVAPLVLKVNDNCAEWRGLSNHTRNEWAQFSQGHRRERQKKKHVTLTWKFPWKSCSTTHLLSLSFNLKILKAFLQTFPTKMKPTNALQKKKNEARKAKKEGERESEK